MKRLKGVCLNLSLFLNFNFNNLLLANQGRTGRNLRSSVALNDPKMKRLQGVC